MVYIEGNSHLDLLFQKALRYEHHRENFRESLSNNVTPFGLRIKKAPAIVPVNEDFHIKWQKILKSAEKELIELLLLESETIIAKIQFEVDNSVNALFPEDQEGVINHLKEKNHKLKEKLKKRREKKWKKFTNRPNYGYYSRKGDLPHQQVLVSSPEEVVGASDSSSLHRNVTVRKNKRKRKSYAEIVKEKISERKGDKQKTLAIEYKKNDDKHENLDNTQSRKTKKALDRNFNESDEDLVNILTDLEPSVEGVSNLDIQFDTQLTNKVSDIDLSNQ